MDDTKDELRIFAYVVKTNGTKSRRNHMVTHLAFNIKNGKKQKTRASNSREREKAKSTQKRQKAHTPKRRTDIHF